MAVSQVDGLERGDRDEAKARETGARAEVEMTEGHRHAHVDAIQLATRQKVESLQRGHVYAAHFEVACQRVAADHVETQEARQTTNSADGRDLGTKNEFEPLDGDDGKQVVGARTTRIPRCETT